MKYLFLILFGILTCDGFSQEYLLADENADKTHVADFIHKLIEENKLKDNPVIVVNERVLKMEELNNLNFHKSDILKINSVEKDNQQIAEMYGPQSLNGVILIKTKPLKDKDVKSIYDHKVLYLVDNNPITQKEVEAINADEIKLITVIKDKKAMSQYTADHYDGIILIEMKK